MTPLWHDLSPSLRARIEREAPHVAAYLQWEPGRHRPPRGLIWAVFQRASHAGVGRTRAVQKTCSELGVQERVVWAVLSELETESP